MAVLPERDMQRSYIAVLESYSDESLGALMMGMWLKESSFFETSGM